MASTDKPEYLLRRLDVAQIATYWPVISETIVASAPPTVDASPFICPGVFQGLMNGSFQAWAMTALRDKPQVCMVMVTRWNDDPVTGEKYLMIFSLYGFDPVPNQSLREAFETVKTFAKGGGATRILAYTNNPRVVELGKAMNAETDWSLLAWRVAE